ncbi:MAG: AEC family transporter [Hyphomicrobiaceae bacterium]|nr:AEC family transporter [Hyphomicrobiaceae bacterium]
MYDVVLIVAPVFGLIMLGFLLSKLSIMSEQAGSGLAEFVFVAAVPALLFRMMVTADMPEGASPLAMWGSFYFAAAILWATATLATRFVLRRSARDGAAIAMGSTFGNIVMLGIPLAFDRFGPEAATPIAIIISLSSPLFWSMATVQIELVTEREDVSWVRQAQELFMSLVKNPLIISLVAGLAWRATGLGLHPIPDKMISLLGQAAIPAALVALGLGLTAFRIQGQLPTVAVICTLSLAVFPALVWIMAFYVFTLPPVWAGVAVLFAACPPGANAFLFASRYEAAKGSISAAVALGTALSIVSVTIILVLLSKLLPGV